MNELIKIAFSGFDMRLGNNEKQIEKIVERLDNLIKETEQMNAKLKELSFNLESKSNYNNEMEEYKFGE